MKHRCIITKHLLDNILDLHSFLNDETLNGYLLSLPTSKVDNMFSTFFYTAICDDQNQSDNFKRSLKYTRKYPLGIYTFKTAFIPINIPNCHWFLLHVHLDTREIIVYDSLYNERQVLTVIKTVIEFLDYEYEIRVVPPLDPAVTIEICDLRDDVRRLHGDRKGKWGKKTLGKPLQQTDTSSCGAFVCLVCKRIINCGPLDFNQEEVYQFRRTMCYLLATQAS